MRYLLYAGGLLLVSYLLTGLTQVRPGERAVVRRFGRVVDTPGPGLWVGLPWGMDRVDRVAVDEVRRLSVGYRPGEDEGVAAPAGQLLTGDHNLVNLQLSLHYTVRDDQFEDYYLQADRAEELLARAAESVLAECVAGQTVDELLIQGKTTLPGQLIEALEGRLAPYHLGVKIQAASVAYLLPPDEVKEAFDEVSR